MHSSINKKLILDNDTQDLMSEKQRTYFSEKLQDAESYNAEHPETMTSEEFYKKIINISQKPSLAGGMLSKYADKTKWPEELSAMEGELKAKHEKSM